MNTNKTFATSEASAHPPKGAHPLSPKQVVPPLRDLLVLALLAILIASCGTSKRVTPDTRDLEPGVPLPSASFAQIKVKQIENLGTDTIIVGTAGINDKVALSDIDLSKFNNDLPASGDVNVQSNWNETDNTSDQFILNKPTTISAAQAAAITANTAKNTYPAADATKLAGIAAGAEVNVQSDWNETDNTSDAFILNKPTIPAASTDDQNIGTMTLSAAGVLGVPIEGGTAGSLDISGLNPDFVPGASGMTSTDMNAAIIEAYSNSGTDDQDATEVNMNAALTIGGQSRTTVQAAIAALLDTLQHNNGMLSAENQNGDWLVTNFNLTGNTTMNMGANNFTLVGTTDFVFEGTGDFGVGVANAAYKMHVREADNGVIGVWESTGSGDSHGLRTFINTLPNGTALDNHVSLASTGDNSGSLGIYRGNTLRIFSGSNGVGINKEPTLNYALDVGGITAIESNTADMLQLYGDDDAFISFNINGARRGLIGHVLTGSTDIYVITEEAADNIVLRNGIGSTENTAVFNADHSVTFSKYGLGNKTAATLGVTPSGLINGWATNGTAYEIHATTGTWTPTATTNNGTVVVNSTFRYIRFDDVLMFSGSVLHTSTANGLKTINITPPVIAGETMSDASGTLGYSSDTVGGGIFLSNSPTNIEAEISTANGDVVVVTYSGTIEL